MSSPTRTIVRIEWLVCVLLIACSTPEERALEALELGVASLESGDRPAAVERFTEATKLDPTLVDGWEHLSQAQIEGELWHAARESAKKAAQLQPNAVRHQVIIGRASTKLEAWDDAITAYDRAVKLGENTGEIHLEIGRAQEQVENVEEALAAYRRSMGVKAPPFAARLALARLLLDRRELDEAGRVLVEAEALEEGAPEERQEMTRLLKRFFSNQAEFARNESGGESAAARAERAETAARQAAERRARLAEAVSRVSMANIIGTSGGTSAVSDVLSDPDVNPNLDDAFDGVRGVGVANGARRGSRSGGGAVGGLATIGSLRSPGERTSTLTARVTLDSITTNGDVEQSRAVIRRFLNRFRSCYERAPSSTPRSDRVTLQIEVAASGGVTSSTLSDSTLSDTAVSSCIAAASWSMRFPARDDGRAWSVRAPVTLRFAE